jgi:hypothetical protein
MSSSATHFLVELAALSAARWHALGAQTFPGELSIATDNSVYRFANGIFRGRVKNGSRSFEVPKAMRGTRLIGFLHDEGGLWSLSPRWREGAHAALWKPTAPNIEAPDAIAEDAFILTSPTASFTLEEPEPKPHPNGPEPTPSPWMTRPPQPKSGVMIRRVARPPSIRQPLPASMTRIHGAANSALSPH